LSCSEYIEFNKQVTPKGAAEEVKTDEKTTAKILYSLLWIRWVMLFNLLFLLQKPKT
jgi:hypothetical protein